jgi:hypothetical protein
MIQWLFDRRNSHGFLPNLIKDETLKPGTPQWWDLAIKPPFSLDFTFLKYCKLDGVVQNCTLVSDYITKTASAYYPININFFDENIDYIDLMDEYSKKRFINGDFRVLFYYTEGDNPDPEIYRGLEKMYDKHNITSDSIRFVTGNYKLKQTHPFVYFPDMELYYRYLQILENNFVTKHNLSKREKKFTCLIRADKAWRKIYASFLYQMGITEQGYFSYIGYKYDTSNAGLNDFDQWQDYDDSMLADTLSFELKTPIRCDSLNDHEHNNHKLVNHEFYTNAYFNFVVETLFDNDVCVVSEKTFKPILNLQPFIVLGNPGTLSLLHDLGYKTFEDVIRETYDKETDHRERMSLLLKTSFDLAQLSDTHHLRIQNIIADVLAHNQKVLLSPKVQRINKLLNQLEY